MANAGVYGAVVHAHTFKQNDIWQAPTWASMEWSGQWKLLHYFIRRTYEHVLVSPYYLNGSINIYVVVDVANYDITYNLKVDIISWAKVECTTLDDDNYKN